MLASEVAGLGLRAKWDTTSRQRGTLLLLARGEPQPIAVFDYTLVGHDQKTGTPVFVVNSTVKGGKGVTPVLLPPGDMKAKLDYQGRGLGKLGYLLVAWLLTTKYKGWLIPDAARGEETSPEAWRVWNSLATSGELLPHPKTVLISPSGDRPRAVGTAWSWAGTLDPQRVLQR
jgi:hypothetical protein